MVNLLYIHPQKLFSDRANIVQVIQMCEAFCQHGLKVVLALPAEKGCDSACFTNHISEKLGKPISFSIVLFNAITVMGRLSFLGGYFGVRGLVKKYEFDICVTRNSLYAAIVVRQGKPVVYEAHNSLIHNNIKILDRFFKRVLLSDVTKDNFWGFVTISEALRAYWEKLGVPTSKLVTLHDGVDAEKFGTVQSKDMARHSIRLDRNEKIVTYVGSLYKDRGIEVILELALRNKDLFFLVVGGPQDRKEFYAAQCIERGIANINLVGSVLHKDVPSYLYASDVLLMIWTDQVKTIKYCSPLKMFEYMAASRPIVGHAYPTIKEVLSHRETAYLVEPGSVTALSQNIREALSDPRSEEIGRRARKLVLSQYTWYRRAEAILKQSIPKTVNG